MAFTRTNFVRLSIECSGNKSQILPWRKSYITNYLAIKSQYTHDIIIRGVGLCWSHPYYSFEIANWCCAQENCMSSRNLPRSQVVLHFEIIFHLNKAINERINKTGNERGVVALVLPNRAGFTPWLLTITWVLAQVSVESGTPNSNWMPSNWRTSIWKSSITCSPIHTIKQVRCGKPLALQMFLTYRSHYP